MHHWFKSYGNFYGCTNTSFHLVVRFWSISFLSSLSGLSVVLNGALQHSAVQGSAVDAAAQATPAQTSAPKSPQSLNVNGMI